MSDQGRGLADVGDGWATGAGRDHRLVEVTADLGILPDKATWYLATNLPRSGGPEDGSPHPAASLAEVVRICAIKLDRAGLQAGQG